MVLRCSLCCCVSCVELLRVCACFVRCLVYSFGSHFCVIVCVYVLFYLVMFVSILCFCLCVLLCICVSLVCCACFGVMLF